MNYSLCTPLMALTMAAMAVTVPGGKAAEEPAPTEREKAVAAMLPEQPTGLGRPAAERDVWAPRAATPAGQKAIERGNELLAEPIPEQPDDLFLDFSRTGNRTRWQAVSGQRRGRFTALVMAECLEYQGRFIPAIAAIVDALCAERTWVMPAHDSKLTNFNGTTIDIDLASSALAWNMATADWLLGDKLPAATRQKIRENVRRFVLDPYRDMFTGKREPNWWMKTTNNWNSVCLAGVTGAALAQIESREERARYVVAAEQYSRNFLKGFTPDGYCSEGLGYWNYGFGHYLLLGETVRQATNGGVDLLALPEVKAPATFGAHIGVIGGVYPAFADCGVNSRPASNIMWFVNRRYGLGLKEYDDVNPASLSGSLFEAMIYGFPNAASQTQPAATTTQGAAPRSWFQDAGILIGRPAPGSRCRLGVALKGGHNAEHHNHNDLGSFVVVLGERAVLLDPGSETYSARTFSSRRYESKLLNSYGHPVPVVAGQLQRTGREAAAKVLKSEFGDTTDTLQLDLKAGYAVPELQTLTRTFVYSRAGEGSLTITDQVEMNSPQAFETALIHRGGWQREEDGSLVIYDVDEAVRVQIDTGGKPFTVEAEQIHEEAAVHPTRLAIRLTEPVTAATVTVKVAPVVMPGEEGVLLRNGGFEFGSLGWDLPHNGLGALSTERAASGKQSLRVQDDADNRGSNIYSARIPVNGAGTYELRGKVFHVSGEGIGMYVRYFNAQRELINEQDARGNMAPVGSLTGAKEAWEPFAFRFETPAETAAIQVWIHSFNASRVDAFLDDLEIVPAG